MKSGFDVNHLLEEARNRWLKPAEVLFILQNNESFQITEQTPQKPTSGSLFLFNKRVNRFFRKDGHNWRKKKDGKSVGEAHERLKVNNVEALNCYYAHGEENRNFQRRSYWMLDAENEHIVLVHYREITEGKSDTGSISGFSPNCSYTVNNFAKQNLGTSSLSDLPGSYQSLSSPGSGEVSSSVVAERQVMNHLNLDGNEIVSTLPKVEVTQVLRRIEEQLSLDDDSFKDMVPFDNQKQDIDGTTIFGYDECATLQQHQYYGGDNGTISSSTDLATWKEIDSLLFPQENFVSTYSSEIVDAAINISDYHVMQPIPGQIQRPLEADSGLIRAQERKFKIKEIVPDWGFANEVTKVIIIGSFACNPSETSWACLFDDLKVPIKIIENGVLCCHAPPKSPGKATVRITCDNEETCSEVIDFEYRDKHSTCNKHQHEENRSIEELLLLVQFVQMLLPNLSVPKGDGSDLNFDPSRIQKDSEDSMDKILQTLIGSETSSGSIDWVLQELLKDKLQQWLCAKFVERDYSLECPLSKKEQGIIHLVAGLGFTWALNLILDSGVGVNFRDKNGCTALHWAARFGREEMVAALVASGASPGLVTDPTAENPGGETPASIAAARGHKGLAGYLSELSLTSHLSSLTLEEAELSKRILNGEADVTLSNILTDSVTSGEDQLSMQQTLAAVRNASQAAALIQSAFRAHSFRKRQQKEAATSADCGVDEYGFTSDEIRDLSAASKMVFSHHLHDRNSAALSIQKNYRCWKGRNDYLTMRQKAVKIQAHVRGYQVRKKYKVICWAVGFLDKVVLRWRRKGTGLRGFKPEGDSIDEDYESMLKVFRKQKVDETINEAVERVLSMIHSPEARQQYARMLEKFKEAKAQLGVLTDEEAWTLQADFVAMDNDDILSSSFPRSFS